MGNIADLAVGVSVDDSEVKPGLGKIKGLLVGGLAAAGAAASVALGSAISGEAAADKLAAQLGATQQESAKIGKVAGKLYADAYGDSLGGVNSAVGAVMTSIEGMDRASSRRLENVTKKALDFAAVFEIDVNRAAQVAGQAISTGLASNATEAFDLITTASQRVPANLREDVLDAADEYGQFFSSLGFNGQQAFAMLVDGSAKGMYGIDKLGDSVKEFTIRSTDMSTTSKDAYKTLGLDARSMADAILRGGDDAQSATQRIVEGLLSLPAGAKQANAAIALFGTPLEDLNTSEIPAFLQSLQGGSKAMDGFGGSSKRMGDTFNDNAANNIEAFKRQVSTTFVDLIGGRALPIVNDTVSSLRDNFGPALQGIADTGSAVVGFFREHETAAKVLLGTITALVVVTQAHAGVMAVQAAGGMVAWLTQTKIITSVTKVWTAVNWALNASILANPVVLIVAGIVALGVALVVAYKKSETFRKIVNGAFDKVVGAGKKVGHFFTDTLPGAVGKAIGWVKSNWPTILAILTGPFGLAVLAITKNWDKIEAGGRRVIGFIKSIPGRITGAIGDLGKLLVNAGSDVIEGLWNGLKDRWEDVKDWFGDVTSMIPDLKGPPARDKKLLDPAGRLIMQGLLNGLQAGESGLTSYLNRITNRIENGLTKDLKRIERNLEKTLDGIAQQRESKSITKKAANAQIKAAEAAAAAAEKSAKSQAQSMLKLANQQGRTLNKLAKQYDAAKEALEGFVNDKAAMSSGISTGIQGELDLASLITPDETTTNAFGFSTTKTGGVTFEAVAGAVAGLAQRAKKFANKLKNLLKAGVPRGLVNEVAGLGSAQGIQVADALLSGSGTQIANLASDYADIETWSNKAGDIVAGAFYDSSIDAQKAFIKNLLKKPEIKAAASAFATTFSADLIAALTAGTPATTGTSSGTQPKNTGGKAGQKNGSKKGGSKQNNGRPNVTSGVGRVASGGSGDDRTLTVDYDRLAAAMDRRPVQVQADVYVDKNTSARIVQVGSAQKKRRD